MNTSVPLEKKINQTVLNLVVEGGLLEYKPELELIVAEIYRHDCGIVCEKHATSSWIAATPHNKNRSLIHIALKNREKPIDIIWSMLHEFGHVLQDVKELPLAKSDSVLEHAREKDAWDKAEMEMNKYSNLVLLTDDFHSYRDKQLNSYRKD